jgi:hypothetical protein
MDFQTTLANATALSKVKPGLVPLLVIGDIVRSHGKNAAYRRVGVDLQLEDQLLRDRVISSTRKLLTLIDTAERTGLLMKGEFLDEHWLARIPTDMRRSPDPTLGILPILTDQVEMLERKLTVWSEITKHPRITMARRNTVREFLLKLAPGVYESWYRLREVEPFKPLGPYSAASYAKQVEKPSSFLPEDHAAVHHAFRLERRSNDTVRRQDPKGGEEKILQWWNDRHEQLVSDEGRIARNNRLLRLMKKYGVNLPVIEPINPTEEEQNLPPFDIKIPAPNRPLPSEKIDIRKIFRETPVPPPALGECDGWIVHGSGTPVTMSPLKLWEITDPPMPQWTRYTPKIEIGHPDIQKACELLAKVGKRVKSIDGFDAIKDVLSTEDAMTSRELLPSESAFAGLTLPAANTVARPTVASVLPRVHPAPWPPQGEQVSVLAKLITARGLPNGQVALRWEGHLPDENAKLPRELSAFEVVLSKNVTREFTVDSLSKKLHKVLAAPAQRSSTDPFGYPVVHELLKMGRVALIKNFHMAPLSVGGAGHYDFELAEEAVIQDLSAKDPGVAISIKGNTARFQDCDLLGSIVEMDLVGGRWENCHLDNTTAVAGNFGRSVFDQKSTLRCCATDADLRQLQVEGESQQQRLKGLLFKAASINRALVDQLKLGELSEGDWEKVQERKDLHLGKGNLIGLLRSIDPDIDVRMPKHESPKQPEGSSETRQNRTRLRIKSDSPYTYFSLCIADPSSPQPCQLYVDTYVKDPQGLKCVQGYDAWEWESIHYHEAFFRLLRYYSTGTMQLGPQEKRRTKQSTSYGKRREFEDIYQVGEA